MATLVQYIHTVNQESSGDGIAWLETENAYGQNVLLTNSSYCDGAKNTYVTDLFNAYFLYSEIRSFFNENLDKQISKIEYEIKYKISTTSGATASSVLDLYLFNSSDGRIDIEPYITNNTYSTSSEESIKTARFVFDLMGNGCPSISQVNNESFKVVSFISVENPDQASILLEIYEIKQTITLSLLFNQNITVSITEKEVESYIQNDNIFDFGSFFVGEKFTKIYTIKNIGSLDLIISSFVLTSNLKIKTDNEIPIRIRSGSSINIEVSFDVLAATHYNEYFQIESNSELNSIFVVNFKYTGAFISTNSPVIDVYFHSSKILNNRIVSLTSAPVNISNFTAIKVFNYGNSNLSIASVSVSGDGSVGIGTDLINSSIIIPNSYKTLNILMNTASIGNKQINIVINSNDLSNNPFKFYITYSVIAHIIASISSGNDRFIDGSNFNIGSLDKGKSFTKSYVLKNNGIYKTMIVNSISTNKDLTLIGSYNLPFTLMPNSGNSLVFVIGFNTNNLGLKDGSFIINYDEGSVPE